MGGHYHIAIGRPLSRSGVGFALDSHSATKVDRVLCSTKMDDGTFSLSCVRQAERMKASLFAKEGRGRSPPRETAGFNQGILSEDSIETDSQCPDEVS